MGIFSSSQEHGNAGNQGGHSHNQQASFFGQVGSNQVNSSYAVPVSQHIALKQPTKYTLQNLDTIMQHSISNNYPELDTQIYTIKKYNATYQGPFVKGFPQGKGITHFSNGGYYYGDFISGDANGNGLYVYPNGSVYQGQFTNSLFNGNGTLIYADKRLKYQGNFMNGLPDGQGRQAYGDGSYYQGNFTNGGKSGHGIYQWANGKKYQGEFQNGLMHGKGVLTDSNNNVLFNGQFVKGLKSGYGVYCTDDGVFEGNFQNDYLNGQGNFMFNDGKVYEGNFLNSMMHGEGKIYYPTNQVAQGHWQYNHNKSLSSLKNDPNVASKIQQIQQRHKNHLAGRQSEGYATVTDARNTNPHNSNQYNSYNTNNNLQHSQNSIYRNTDNKQNNHLSQSNNDYDSYNQNRPINQSNHPFILQDNQGSQNQKGVMYN